MAEQRRVNDKSAVNKPNLPTSRIVILVTEILIHLAELGNRLVGRQIAATICGHLVLFILSE